jgi:hypothetical protein
MPGSVFFKAAGANGDTDIKALSVKEIGPAVGYYTQCLDTMRCRATGFPRTL